MEHSIIKNIGKFLFNNILMLITLSPNSLYSQDPKLMWSTAPSSVRKVAFDKTGDYFLTQSYANEFLFYETKSGKLVFNFSSAFPDSLQGNSKHQLEIKGVTNDNLYFVLQNTRTNTYLLINKNTGRIDSAIFRQDQFSAYGKIGNIDEKSDTTQAVLKGDIIFNKVSKRQYKLTNYQANARVLLVSPNLKYLIIVEQFNFNRTNNIVKVWHFRSGDFLYQLSPRKDIINSTVLSNNEKYLLISTQSFDHYLYDLQQHKVINMISSDQKYDHQYLLSDLYYACFDDSSNQIALNVQSGVVILSIRNGEIIVKSEVKWSEYTKGIDNHRTPRVEKMFFAKNGEHLVISLDRPSNSDSSNLVVNVSSGAILYASYADVGLRANTRGIYQIANRNKVVFFDKKSRIDIVNLDKLNVENAINPFAGNARFINIKSSATSNKIIIEASKGKAYLFDLGQIQIMFRELTSISEEKGYNILEIDGDTLYARSETSLVKYNIASDTIVSSTNVHSNGVLGYTSKSADHEIKLYTGFLNYGSFLAIDYKRNQKFDGDSISSLSYWSSKELYVTVDNQMRRISFRSRNSFETLFSLSIFNSKVIITDKFGRFDCEASVRKDIYYTCGSEIIELEQIKNTLWVPNLAERVLAGEVIYNPKLTDINLCNTVPGIKDLSDGNDRYKFVITPKSGGLGETVLSVNDIEIKRYKRKELQSVRGDYILEFPNNLVNEYFVSGQSNKVTLKSYTLKGDIVSRGSEVIVDNVDEIYTRPNVYAVFIGISDYKGTELDLKYAAKDAEDMSNALGRSFRKLFNTDSNNYVYVYNLNTSKNRFAFPEKGAIRDLFTEIGRRARPNDILLIYFAGHGVTNNTDKQFYFLTAEAARTNDIEEIKRNGISTNELMDWIQPVNIKAQKRVLIFDACNSGQAIRDFVKIGRNDQGYVSARNDQSAVQIQAIEKLSEKSGLIIFSASSSDQSAYESNSLSQGFFTYSLLKALKYDNSIIEDQKYLNLIRWFTSAEKNLYQFNTSKKFRQTPQIVATTNFNIGIVDAELKTEIILAEEKIVFGKSEFRNAQLKLDNLRIRYLFDEELSALSNSEKGEIIILDKDSDNFTSFRIIGDYTINDDTKEISLSIILVKGDNEIVNRFEVKCKTSELGSTIKKTVLEIVKYLTIKKTVK